MAIHAFAGGFQIYLQGTQQVGMGGTGVGLHLDAAGISYNPGSIAFLKRNSVYAGGNLIFSRTAWIAPQPSSGAAEMEPYVGTPFNFYANYGFLKDKKLQAGLGIFTPFGSSVTWPDDWEGRFVIQNIKLQTIFIQPTLSYRIGDKLGIGAGFIYATGGVELNRAIPVTDQNFFEGRAELYGDAKGYGYNIGVLFQASDNLSFGIDYRSSVKMKVDDGIPFFEVPNSLMDSFQAYGFTSEINLPFMASLGIGYKATPKLTLAFDVNYVGWSSFDSLIFDYKRNTTVLQDTRQGKKYENSYAFRVGGSYQLKETMMIRGGAYYDITPVPDGYVSPETPDSDRLGLTLGFGYKMTEKLDIDLSLLYIEGSERTDINVETGFGGTYKTRAVIPGLSIQYSF